MPDHLLINKLPTTATCPTFYTLNNMGPAISPYRITNRAEFIQLRSKPSVTSSSITWKNPELTAFIPFHPDQIGRQPSTAFYSPQTRPLQLSGRFPAQAFISGRNTVEHRSRRSPGRVLLHTRSDPPCVSQSRSRATQSPSPFPVSSFVVKNGSNILRLQLNATFQSRYPR